MKKKTCDHCGGTVVVAERGETVVGGETPREHLARTGHTHVREPVRTDCEHCGNLWYYQGGADRVTCPRCRGKTTAGVSADC